MVDFDTGISCNLYKMKERYGIYRVFKVKLRATGIVEMEKFPGEAK